jgi:hypothetical protein
MINNDYITEIGYLSVNHVGEELCGDNVVYVQPNDKTRILVLADGLGSGVKANILSTLTAKMLSTMMANNMSIEECVISMAETLPICSVRGVAYSTFSIIKIVDNKYVDIYNYDNPTPFMIRNGKVKDLNYTVSLIENKKIYHAKVEAELNDTFFMMSDGVKHAGIGASLNFGWDMDQIKDYMECLYHPIYSSKSLATILVEHCDNLYDHKPGDDTTAAVLRVRERNQANLMFGPATNREDDEKMLSLFFGKEGTHIVSGGTTSTIVARYLNEEIEVDLSYLDKEIPPTGIIRGVDLVTEGVITLNKVLDYAKNYSETNSEYFNWSFKQDGASLITRILFEEATDINFFVGCAINPAHQGEDVKINFAFKMQLIEELSKRLKSMGKNVKVSYF